MKPTKARPWPEYFDQNTAYTKVHEVAFNPASHKHIGERLQKVYSWKPTLFNEEGAVTDEKVLAPLPYDCIPDILEHMTLNKRLGQLAEGKQAWLKVQKDGKIHGRVKPTGTRTGRCSHHSPNLGQVPHPKSPYGTACRELFQPIEEGWSMVGADAASIELRMLAHRMAAYDDGAFAKLIEEGGDVHEAWRVITGLFTREIQKTFTFAMLYGAGNEKLGEIVLDDWRHALRIGITREKAPPLSRASFLGRKARLRLLRQIPALEQLLEETKRAHKRGYIKGLDGRVIACKSAHGAINDLLQGDAATVMKHACVLFDDYCRRKGLDQHFHYMLNVHDEVQLEVRPGFEKRLGAQFVLAIRQAGTALGLRVRLDGEYKVGKNWAETH